MAITRRQFLKRTGIATAGTLFGPSLWSNPFVQRAMADTIGDRYFVVIFLDGGNDGLNTVVPLANSVTPGAAPLRTNYQDARNSIRLSVAQLTPYAIDNDPGSGCPLAFHPGLAGLHELYGENHVAVIQGCGYPNQNLSHDESRTIWQTANPTGAPTASGWMGRYLAANYGSTQIPAVCVDYYLADELAQNTTGVVAIRYMEEFAFPVDPFYAVGSDYIVKNNAFSLLANEAAASPLSIMKHAGNNGVATYSATQSYPACHTAYMAARESWSNDYDALDTGTASRLKEVAKVIYGVESPLPGVTARCFQISNGGYDTHSSQGGATGNHADLHRELGDAIRLFYRDCESMGVANKVCIMVWSEFSRRIGQNDSGTDHGSQGPMFVIGGSVTGGVYGKHPNIDALALDGDGNTVYSQAAGDFRSTDFRDVYGTLLTKWLNMPEPQVLSDILPPDSAPIGEEDYYWTTPDFDLGFI